MKAGRSPNLAWPLVGRATELERFTALLRAGEHALILAGPPGVGKTRLANECLAIAASEGFAPLRATATQGAAGLPFGAFASLLPDLVPDSNQAQVLRQVADAIQQRGEGKPIALLVDDAHLLDGSSAALTHLLAHLEKTFVLATMRSGDVASDAIVALWKDGMADRLELQPLTLSEVSELLAAALQASVDGGAAHLFWQRSQGNALFLRELVLAALEAGVLREKEGMLHLTGSLPISPRLVEIVESRISGVADRDRFALDLLAIGEPVGVELFQRIHPDTELEVLERRGLVQIERSGQRLDVRLAHPVHGEVLRARLSRLRSKTVARSLAEELERTGARRREDLLRIATLRLEGGGPTNPDMMLQAAVAARQSCALPLSERLARTAAAAGAGFEAALLLGQLSWLQGRPEEAERRLSSLADQDVSDAQRVMLAGTRMTILYVGLDRTDEALRVLNEAEAKIVDVVYRDQITVERARLLGRSGDHASAAELIDPLLDRAQGPTLVAACIAAANAMGLTGRIGRAIEATERGLKAQLAQSGAPFPFGPYFHLALRWVALINAGRFAEARELGEREYGKALEENSVEAKAFFSAALAGTALAEGRVQSAVRLARESAGGFQELKWGIFVRMALSVMVHALALRGEVEVARAALSEIDALAIPPTNYYGPEVVRARAWTEVAAGSLGEGRRLLQEAATMARSGGASTLESAALHDLARLGAATEVTLRLQELGECVEGPLASVRAAHAVALRAKGASRLEAASAAFEDLGAILLAAEAAADAATAWQRAGEPRKRAAAERRAHQLTERCEGARTPALTAITARAVLSGRELEIARLAAAGASSKEIATRLYLSVRTVDNTLYTAYEKLGVSGRAELASALKGWPSG